MSKISKMTNVPVSDKDYTADFYGCVICSEIAVVTGINPQEKSDEKTFPFASTSSFLPVYCSKCVAGSMGYGRTSRTTLKNIKSLSVYKKASNLMPDGMPLKVQSQMSMFMIVKSCRIGFNENVDIRLSMVNDKFPKKLRACIDRDFFSDPNLQLPMNESSDTDMDCC